MGGFQMNKYRGNSWLPGLTSRQSSSKTITFPEGTQIGRYSKEQQNHKYVSGYKWTSSEKMTVFMYCYIYSKAGDRLPDFKLYYKVIVIKP